MYVCYKSVTACSSYQFLRSLSGAGSDSDLADSLSTRTENERPESKAEVARELV